jgi:hypothetical protein
VSTESHGDTAESGSSRLRGAWLAIALLSCLAFTWRNMDLLGDGCWYIATGRYVLAHHAFPADELFAYSAVRGPWFVNMPLSEPLFAWVADDLGVRALLGLCTLAFTGALALFWLPHAKGIRARAVTWPLVVLAIYVQRGDLQARSQTLADLAIGVVFVCLFRLRDGARVPLWVPLVLGAVWVNVHPSYLLGVLLPLGFALGLRVGPPGLRPRLRPMLAFAAVLALGGLANPYGYRLIAEFLRFMTAESTTAIDLFQSPDFTRPDILVALLVACAMTFACLRASTRDAGAGEALLLVAILTATCVSRRYVEILAAYEIVLAGRLLRSVPWARGDVPRRAWAALFVVPFVLAAVSLRETKDPWQNLPVEATTFIEQNQLPDNVMNILHWGGYLDYAWGGRRRIFIDGRTTQFENGVLEDHGALVGVREGWGQRLDAYLINTVLWENGAPLDRALSGDPDWAEVYRKGIAVVYVRKKPLR